MASREKPIEEIEILIENETRVSQLYKAYAEIFLDYNDFWISMAKDETNHAKYLGKLYSQIKGGSVYFKEGRFKKAAIKTFLNYLENKLLQTKKQEISLINALSISVDIENTKIERFYSEVFEGDSIELKHILLSMLADEKRHQEKIKKALTDLKQENSPQAGFL